MSQFNGSASLIEAPIKTPCSLPIGQFRFKQAGRDILLLAVHAPPPVQSCNNTTEPYLDEIATWIENGQLNRDIGIGKNNDLVIIAGDLNNMPWQNGISHLRESGLRNPHSKFNFTTATWKPFKGFWHIAKIDYILYPDAFKTTTSVRFNIEESDHLGILSDLELNAID